MPHRFASGRTSTKERAMASTSYADGFAASLRAQIGAIPASEAREAPPSGMEPPSDVTTGRIGGSRDARGRHPLDALAFALATLSILALVAVLQVVNLPLRLSLAVAIELALLGALGVLPASARPWVVRLVAVIGWGLLLAVATFLLVVCVQAVNPVLQAAQAGDSSDIQVLVGIAVALVALGIPVALGHASLVAALRPSASPSAARAAHIIGLAVVALLAASEPAIGALLTAHAQARGDAFDAGLGGLIFMGHLRAVVYGGSGVILAQLVLWDGALARSGARVPTWEWVVEAAALLVVALSIGAPPALALIPAGLVVLAAVVRHARFQLLLHLAAALTFLSLLGLGGFSREVIAIGLLLGLPAALTRQARLSAAAEIGLLLVVVYATQIFFFSSDPRVAFSGVVVLALLAVAEAALVAALRAQAGRDGDKQRQGGAPAITAMVAALGILALVGVVGTGYLTVAAFAPFGLVGSARSVLLLLDLLLWIAQVTLVALAIAALRRLPQRRTSSEATPSTLALEEGGVAAALQRQQQRLTTLTEWLADDPQLRNLVDGAIGRQVAASERRQRIYGAILGIASLVVGWLLSLFATTDALAHLGQGLFR
jgi:hypothetical protein